MATKFGELQIKSFRECSKPEPIVIDGKRCCLDCGMSAPIGKVLWHDAVDEWKTIADVAEVRMAAWPPIV